MTAFSFLRDWIRENRPAAALVSGAIALFAAVAVVNTFGLNLESTIPSVVWILVIGFVLLIIERLIDEPFAMRALAWFMGALVVLWVAVFIWSKLNSKNEGVACLAYFWQPCAVTADQVAANTSPAVVVSTQNGSGSISSTIAGQYSVWIQFSGYERATVVELAGILKRGGWNVRGADKGGERIESAAGKAEVRYRNGDKQAAEALAAAITATKVKTVTTVQNDDIQAKSLEVWIGQ